MKDIARAGQTAGRRYEQHGGAGMVFEGDGRMGDLVRKIVDKPAETGRGAAQAVREVAETAPTAPTQSMRM